MIRPIIQRRTNMAVLEKKIDFALVFSVKNANPNGDPLNGNIPRITFDGIGEISDVCLKRKIRNRLMESGENIFVQSDDNRLDEYKTLKDRADAVLKNVMDDDKKIRETACKKWLDVRAFGQVFAYKSGDGKKGAGVSVGIRGPVTIQSAFSLEPVNITSIQITKSVSGEGDGTKKASDTMGMKHRVDFGVYATYGSINPQLAEKTGFSYEDAQKIKQALLHIFNVYGEVENAPKVVRCIIARRNVQPIETVGELVEAVKPCLPRQAEHKYLAKIFQALRIEVNAEMKALEQLLEQSLKLLKTEARMVVITYHSLEDRMVKNFMRSGNVEGKIEKNFYGQEQTPFLVVTKKAITPTEAEIQKNTRARSAKLRAAQRMKSEERKIVNSQ